MQSGALLTPSQLGQVDQLHGARTDHGQVDMSRLANHGTGQV